MQTAQEIVQYQYFDISSLLVQFNSILRITYFGFSLELYFKTKQLARSLHKL